MGCIVTASIPICLYIALVSCSTICTFREQKSIVRTSLPSAFLAKQRKQKTTRMAKLFTYDRDIICLPRWYAKKKETIKIPRSRDDLSKHGLIGKVRLSSDMTEEEVLDEIRSVFHVQMNDDPFFEFHILQATGSTSKSLTIPAVSSSFKWTAAAIAGKNSKASIYILARDKLKVCS